MTDKKMYAPYAPGAPVFPRQQPINEEQVVQECIDCVIEISVTYLLIVVV
jgi:hypothetical protein